jgi:lipoate synthase
MKFKIKQVVSNCMFKIDKADRNRISEMLERIKSVERVADGIYKKYFNNVTKEETVIINEEHFRKCLNILSDVKEKLFSILNRAGLIFRKGEETDLDEFMRSVYEG